MTIWETNGKRATMLHSPVVGWETNGKGAMMLYLPVVG